MNEEQNKRFSPPMIGGSSLLVIFAVLCLIIFALLALSSVQADKRLGDAALSSVEGYYAADTAAEETLARLRAGERPENVEFTTNGNRTVATFVEPISETQELRVEIDFTGGLGNDYRIVQWQSHSTAEVNLDQHINVFGGN